MTIQLSLPLLLEDDCSFANFYPGPNQAIIDCLQQWVQHAALSTPQEPFMFLWGISGAGCSHLLQATCQSVREQGFSYYYINFATKDALHPSLLDNLEHVNWLALDNIQQVLGQPEWEEALFNCYNRIRDQGQWMLIAADRPPVALNCHLADLHSRLCWGVSWQVQPLSDEDKIRALTLRANNRGLVLSAEITHFLLHHCPRNMKFLINLLTAVDTAALRAQQRVTLPFIKKIIQEISSPGESVN